MGFVWPKPVIRLNEGKPSFSFSFVKKRLCKCVLGFGAIQRRGKQELEKLVKDCGNQRSHLRYNLYTSSSSSVVTLKHLLMEFERNLEIL